MLNLLLSTSSTILSSPIGPVSLCGSHTTQVLWDYLIAEFCFPPSVLLIIVFWTICEYDFVPLISPSAHLAGQQRLCPLPNDPPPTIATTTALFPIHTPRLNLLLLPRLDTNTAAAHNSTPFARFDVWTYGGLFFFYFFFFRFPWTWVQPCMGSEAQRDL